MLALIPPLFCPKILSAFTSAENIQAHFRLDGSKEANNMNPDQIAPLVCVPIVCNTGYLRT